MSDMVWKSFKVDPADADWEPAAYNVKWEDGREYGRSNHVGWNGGRAGFSFGNNGDGASQCAAADGSASGPKQSNFADGDRRCSSAESARDPADDSSCGSRRRERMRRATWS